MTDSRSNKNRDPDMRSGQQQLWGFLEGGKPLSMNLPPGFLGDPEIKSPVQQRTPKQVKVQPTPVSDLPKPSKWRRALKWLSARLPKRMRTVLVRTNK